MRPSGVWVRASRRDGRPVAEVGFYNPRTKETRLDLPAIEEWIRKGAQPTEVVQKLLTKAAAATA